MNCIGAENRNVPVAAPLPGKVDPFNYPMPNRRDLMSLQCIGAKDHMKTSTTKFDTIRGASQNMATTDIFGAVPKLHGNRVVQAEKAQNNLNNFDIERSVPRQLHIGLNKPEANLATQDIEGAKPQCVKFKSTRLGQNPLNPTYNLQTVAYLEPEPVRFIRDQMSIDDIPGTRAVKTKVLDIKTRDVMSITDIEGTKAKQRHAPRPNAGKDEHNMYNVLNYRDVTHADFQTKRSTNPLQPEYTIRDEEGKICQIGSVAGSLPNVLPPARQDQDFVNTSLKTTDIHGCAIGTKGLGNFHTRERRVYKDTNKTEDIEKCHSGSLKKSPPTLRSTHPLDPDYQMPGRKELTNINDGFGKRNPVQQAILDRHNARTTANAKGGSTLQKTAEASLGITAAKHQVADVPQNVTKAFYGASESGGSQAASRQSQGRPSQAQKMDAFIKS